MAATAKDSHLRRQGCKRVKDVDRLKDEGNVAFKAGRLEDATAKYTEALDVRTTRSVSLNIV